MNNIRNFYGKYNPNYKGCNKIIFQDNLITKFLIESLKHGNFEIIIDTEDWNKVKQYRWFISKHKYNIYYVITNIKKDNKYCALLLHRVILDVINIKIEVDHKDLNTLNNTKNNLRICTSTQNKMNSKLQINNTSGYKGVHFDKSVHKWQSRINLNYNTKNLGYFKNKICAACAYNNASKIYFGEFARENELFR